nr:hypothetical protein [Tanacetum cinerariifolium]
RPVPTRLPTTESLRKRRGTIAVQRELGKGSIFSAYVPLPLA